MYSKEASCVLSGGALTPAGTSIYIMWKFFGTHIKCEDTVRIWELGIYA